MVLIAYRDHGAPRVPTINEDSCGRALQSAYKGVKAVLENAEHSKYFKSMVRDWVQHDKLVSLACSESIGTANI